MTTSNTSLLGDVSDIDRRRWQMAACRALTEILKRASNRKLKPIDWHVKPNLSLVGHVSSSDYGNVEKDVTAAFDQWCDLLGLTVDGRVTKSGGGIYLVGQHDNWRPKPDLTGARVTVIAETFQLGKLRT